MNDKNNNTMNDNIDDMSIPRIPTILTTGSTKQTPSKFMSSSSINNNNNNNNTLSSPSSSFVIISPQQQQQQTKNYDND
eukprot:UN10536